MNINHPSFEFTKAWPAEMQTAVCRNLVDGILRGIVEFCADHRAGEIQISLLAMAISKEFDDKNVVKLDYPFTSSFARALGSELERAAPYLLEMWRGKPVSVESYCAMQGHAEMIMFFQRNEKELDRFLTDAEKLMVEHTLKGSPHG